MTKYILGGGIAGLISKYFNPEYKLISPDLGGQLNKETVMTTFYLHSSPFIIKLLNELKIRWCVKKIPIFYLHKNNICESVDAVTMQKIIHHKITEFDSDESMSNISSNDMKLCTSQNYMEVLNIDMQHFMSKLMSSKKDIINGKVKLINTQKKFIMVDNGKTLVKLHYEKLISTIPAPDFFRMCYTLETDYHFNYLPAVYIFSSQKPSFWDEDGIYYIHDNNIIYNRVQKYNNGYIYEITGIPDNHTIKKHIKDIINKEIRYVGILKYNDTTSEIEDLKNIKFIGRMATWNHNFWVESIIEKAKEVHNNEQNKKE